MWGIRTPHSEGIAEILFSRWLRPAEPESADILGRDAHLAESPSSERGMRFNVVGADPETGQVLEMVVNATTVALDSRDWTSCHSAPPRKELQR